MRNVLHYAAVCAAGLLATAYVAVSSENSVDTLRSFVFEPAPGSAKMVVNRARKADRLAPSRQAEDGNTVIATVEIVGLRDAAIIYRARDGRMLFRTDPVTNATVVAKGVLLPELTIREMRRPEPALENIPAAVEAVPVPQNAPAVGLPLRSKVLEGCDPAFSPLVASALDNFTGRCLAAQITPVRVATVLR